MRAPRRRPVAPKPARDAGNGVVAGLGSVRAPRAGRAATPGRGAASTVTRLRDGLRRVLGIGERCHPRPWKAVDHDPWVGGYAVEATRERLEHAPSHASDEAPWDRPATGLGIYDYHGMTYPCAGI